MQAAEVKVVQEDAQADLDVALPALEKALKALDSLTKNDITEVKGFAKPPPAVQIVMEAVCILLEVSERVEGTGDQTHQYRRSPPPPPQKECAGVLCLPYGVAGCVYSLEEKELKNPLIARIYVTLQGGLPAYTRISKPSTLL